MKKVLNTVGKRKKAVARATVKKGQGKIRVNKRPLKILTPRYMRMRIEEPLVLKSDKSENLDIEINVQGGGVTSQAEACRVAIANALVDWDNDKELREKFLDYDRSLLVSDARRTEKHKPSRSSAGARRTKQQSKR